jgi:NADPH-dependent curcumin reductase
LLAARPKGLIKESDFKWNETTTRALKDGELLSRNLAFSFDPTQRGWMSHDTYMKAIPLGETMKAGTVGQVVESKRDGFAKGDLVQGLFGWEDYTITNGEGLRGLQKASRRNGSFARAVAARHDRTHRLRRTPRMRSAESG